MLIIMYKRTLANKINQLAQSFPIVAVTGPRQSGKTTLLRDIFADYNYVSLEDLDMREFAESDPRGFLTAYNDGAILDEVQRVPQLFSYLQTHVDTTKRAGEFILSGSQNFLLLENISQSLAGRVALLKLLPLSLEELRNAHYPLNNLEELIFNGCYPKIYYDHINPTDWYPNYIQTYIERDVRLIKNISDLSTFQRFLKMCAHRCGQLLNLSSLATDCGITHNTAKSWLSILEASFIIFLLQPYHSNFNKRLVKMPKLYFYDTGLICSLLTITDYSQLNTHYMRGALFENFVITEFYKHYLNQGKIPHLYFWRDKSGHEIDCIIEDSNKIYAIEIKAGKTIASDYFTGLNYWHALQPSTNNYLIYSGDVQQKRANSQVVSWKNINSILDDI